MELEHVLDMKWITRWITSITDLQSNRRSDRRRLSSSTSSRVMQLRVKQYISDVNDSENSLNDRLYSTWTKMFTNYSLTTLRLYYRDSRTVEEL